MTRFRVLATDEVDPRGVELLRAEPSLVVDERPTRPWQELRGEIGEYDAFVGRSATRLPAELLRDAKRLQVIGRAGVGIPGVIGEVGTVSGSAGINIAEYHQARMTQDGEALAAISVDGTVSEQVRRRLLEVASVRSATVIEGDGQDAVLFE
jgi:phosphoglycerate dehydrogenase-like enzyme